LRVNENDVVARLLGQGDYSVGCDQPTISTWATAMDIQMPYNVERILLLASNLNTSKIALIMKTFEATSAVEISDELLQSVNDMITDQLVVKNEEIIDAMKRCYDDNDYIICPHTAIAMMYHYKTDRVPNVPRVIIATASPEKFPDAIAQAIGAEKHALGVKNIGKNKQGSRTF